MNEGNEATRAPAVSVIMPVYNGERYVAQSIASVLAQEFADWELIVVNDGSTDGTAAILAQFTDPRVRIIAQANAGEAAARNRGLDAARGEFIAFLDADDLYLPRALAATTDFLRSHPECDAVFTEGYFCDAGDAVTGRLSDVRPGPYTGNILEPLVLDATVICGVWCTLTRRAAIECSGARFDPALVFGPDWDFWIHLAVTASFGYLDEPTCMYRIHGGNISVTARAERRRADLIRGRRKVMGAAWFCDLSAGTRARFFYRLLIDLLDGRTGEQREVLADAAFEGLPARMQARLLRHLAGRYLLAGREREFALACLRRSAELDARSLNTQLLLLTGRHCLPAARLGLAARRFAGDLGRKLRTRETPGRRALAALEGKAGPHG